MWDDICELLKYKEKGDLDMENKSKELSIDLERLAVPLVKFLRDNYNHHSTIVITGNQIKLVTDEIGIPVRNEKEM